jgi:hypothetical protein
MKKLILLFLIIVLVFAVWNRQRLYLRDPFGSIQRDGVKEQGAQVFINYSNDVLLQNYNPPMYVTLVQHGQPAGAPATLHCIAYTLCLTDADIASIVPLENQALPRSMSSKSVEFTDAKGRDTIVTLH